MSVRQATASDIDDLAWILVASADDDPCYPYRFPLKHEHAQAFKEHCRRKCAEYLASSTVIVYEVVHPRKHRDKKVVAFSVWEQPQTQRRPKSNRSQTWPRFGLLARPPATHGDESHTEERNSREAAVEERPRQLVRTPSGPKYFAREDRSKAFREGSKAAKARFFDKQYTEGYMFLKILLCHPSYRRQGAATALLRWGMSSAHVQGVNTALFSSPMGFGLYHKLGFREVGRFEVKLEGEEERLDIPAMVLGPPNLVRSRRGSRCAAEAGPTGLRKVMINSGMMAQKA